MAVVRIPDQDKTYTDFAEAKAFLNSIDIEYEIWEPAHPISDGSSADEVLSAYHDEIEKLKTQGNYVTADVIDLYPETPNLDVMLNKFNKEHKHSEDEVRFCIAGSGVFHIHAKDGTIASIEVGPGDLIRVPNGTKHWFDLCSTKRIRCIRLFQDTSGWTPEYTESGAEEGYIPVCMGPAFIAATKPEGLEVPSVV